LTTDSPITRLKVLADTEMQSFKFPANLHTIEIYLNLIAQLLTLQPFDTFAM